MRLLYLKYQKSETLSHQLSWSHYFELLKINDDLERSFYEKQSVLENWSVRELKRQKNTALFQRIALSKNKEKVLELSKEGNVIKDEKSVLKDPYVQKVTVKLPVELAVGSMWINIVLPFFPFICL